MTLRGKMLLAVLGVAGLGIASHEVVYHLRPRPASMQEVGLAWLREEYNIPEDRFRQIENLHRGYFQQCDVMCSEMVSAARPRVLKLGKRHQPGQPPPTGATATPAEERSRRKALCERCLGTMVQHLHAVAALMPQEEGRRFLKEILPELTHPRELLELESAANTPR